jgi:hypothetical protein
MGFSIITVGLWKTLMPMYQDIGDALYRKQIQSVPPPSSPSSKKDNLAETLLPID